MQGTFINVPLPGGSGRVPGVLYAPPEGEEIAGIVILAPGSNGGCGPGVDRQRQGLPLVKSQSNLAHGSIYRRLGLELADAGTNYNWHGHATCSSSSSSQTAAANAKRRSTQSTSSVLPRHEESTLPVRSIAVLQISWRHTHGRKRWPWKKLKFVSSLEIAANDIVAAVHYMHASYGLLPTVISGFSFGGPAAWAAAAKLIDEGVPPAGVVLLAGAGRDGRAFQERQLDTLGCALRCRAAGVAALLLHGTADENVAFEVAQYFYNHLAADRSPALSLGVVAGSEHTFDIARDIIFPALKMWVLGCLNCLPNTETLSAPLALAAGPVAVQLRGGGRSQPFTVKHVPRDFLLKPETKGYSEKQRVGQKDNLSAR